MEPDLMSLMPDVQIAPSATIQQENLYSSLKPQIDSGLGDFNRVFQQHEVDEKPTVLARPNPVVPRYVRGTAKALRVSMLIVVDTKGGVDSVRVLDSSGNEEFDAILIRDVRESWVFKPASKKGRRVRCLLQQTVRVTWEAGSPFGN
jgi:TonB family protein